MIHNASIEKYRTPVGAVTCGSEMMIRLYDVGQEVNKAEIIMYSESFHREYEMKRKKDCMEEHIKMTSEAGVAGIISESGNMGNVIFMEPDMGRHKEKE